MTPIVASFECLRDYDCGCPQCEDRRDSFSPFSLPQKDTGSSSLAQTIVHQDIRESLMKDDRKGL